MGNKGGKSSSSGSNSSSNLGNARRSSQQSSISELDIGQVYEKFIRAAPNGVITRDIFCREISNLEELGLTNVRGTPFGEKLFDFLDTDKSGTLDKKEFITGFALVGKGSIEDKLKLTFKLFDKDGSNTISKDELKEMFVTAWLAGAKIVIARSTETNFSLDDLRQYAEETIGVSAEQIFNELDTDKSGELSFEEFARYAATNPTMVANLSNFSEQVSLTF
eukprot:TRINITY_DN2354_c1_g1_i1.p1 TRINITY_DN2354_c1_g1~~TRINITY_DN2354_c1_g1_i1.p1  ORF type:complete len:221 (-),score=123.75 TRINITY_DN2354_c1_g1_i1:124-786(-)